MDFDKIKVSTQTYIVYSNILNIDLVALTDIFEPTELVTNLKYKTIVKGVIKPPKRKIKKKRVKTFLNCVTMSVFTGDKIINAKIFNNGVFQLTGCKRKEHATGCIQTVIELIAEYGCYNREEGDTIDVYLASVMRNIDFDLSFKIDREAMATYVYNYTDFRVPPLTKGYMGIKIKIPLKDVNDLTVTRMTLDGTTLALTNVSETTYEDLMTNIVKDVKKLKKEKVISISVFQNGKVLMSGVDEHYQRIYYDWFVAFATENKASISYNPPSTTKKTFKLQ